MGKKQQLVQQRQLVQLKQLPVAPVKTGSPTSTVGSPRQPSIVGYSSTVDLLNSVKHAVYVIEKDGEVSRFGFTVIGSEEVGGVDTKKVLFYSETASGTSNLTIWISSETGDVVKAVGYSNNQPLPESVAIAYARAVIQSLVNGLIQYTTLLKTYGIQWAAGEITGENIIVVEKGPQTYTIGGKSYNAYMIRFKPAPSTGETNIEEIKFVFAELKPSQWYFVEAYTKYTDGTYYKLYMEEVEVD